MKHRIFWCVIFVACWSALAASNATRDFVLVNTVVQLGIFLPFANLPAWRNNRLSYVDFAWPAGIAAIGVQLFCFAQAQTSISSIVAAIYLFVGLRMAFWGAHLYRPGALVRDLPRYEYQRQRWARAGFRSERLSVQYEILVQGMANMSFLALPAYLIAADRARTLTSIDSIWIALWLAAFAFESTADLQKRRFIRSSADRRSEVCDVGLWRYSRHPNYFGQWLQWIALVALALPSLSALRAGLSSVVFATLALALAWVVYLMYSTLVHYTGAVPAEHYSRQKRPAYARYQETVNRFFPGPRRTAD